MNNGITKRNYVGRISLTIGYMHQLINFIDDIAREPSDWKNYIPIVTNTATSIGFAIAHGISKNKKYTQRFVFPRED